jgi:hypothetical protein
VKPLTFIVYANKAKLSSFGHEQGYPVIARLANLPITIRNGNGVGGGRVVGWPLWSPHFGYLLGCIMSIEVKA